MSRYDELNCEICLRKTGLLLLQLLRILQSSWPQLPHQINPLENCIHNSSRLPHTGHHGQTNILQSVYGVSLKVCAAVLKKRWFNEINPFSKYAAVIQQILPLRKIMVKSNMCMCKSSPFSLVNRRHFQITIRGCFCSFGDSFATLEHLVLRTF